MRKKRRNIQKQTGGTVDIMKIAHIVPSTHYNDYWGYQENLLPKYHVKMGHEVTLITSTLTFKDGKLSNAETGDYILKDGTRVIRLEKKKYFHRVITSLNDRIRVYPLLQEIKPDFIFFHGLVSTTVFDVIKYKKEINPACIIVQDSHLDYFNYPYTGEGLRDKLVRGFYRLLNKKTLPHIEKIYGVTPWRKEFCEKFFNISEKKTDVLIMGADDENIDFLHKEQIRERIRTDYNINDGDFLVVSGGKIDRNKNFLELMSACGRLPGTRLLLFGNVDEGISAEFNALLEKHDNITHIGWLDANRVYDYFLASDLAVFPGTHSVLWEQACACKIPCVFKRWDGTEHVNNGGNSMLMDDVSESALYDRIKSLIFTDTYNTMYQVAQSAATDVYLYSKIAEKSLECFYTK